MVEFRRERVAGEVLADVAATVGGLRARKVGIRSRQPDPCGLKPGPLRGCMHHVRGRIRSHSLYALLLPTARAVVYPMEACPVLMAHATLNAGLMELKVVRSLSGSHQHSQCRCGHQRGTVVDARPLVHL